MFVQRLRGLINLHVAFTTGAALLLMAAYAAIMPLLPIAPLSSSLNLVPYYLCVALAMVLSAGSVQKLAARFHKMTWIDAAWLATRQIALMLVFISGFMFAFKDRALSRVFMSSYFLICWCMLMLINQGLPQMMSRAFFANARKVPTLFVGTLPGLEKLRGWLASKEALGLHAAGFLSLEGTPMHGTQPPFLGELPDLGQRIEETGAVQVVMMEIPRTQMEGRYVIEACQNKGARLLIYSNLAEQLRHPLITITEDGLQFYTLQDEPLEDPFNRLLKRAYDIALALPVVLLVLPPLALMTWIIQRFQSPGPLLFAQERTGYAHRPFRMFKFRSMRAVTQDAAAEAKQATKGDDRIYPFGRFLRRSSLDELPQFWNVLFGDMSAIGPRPHLIAHDRLFATQMNAYRTRFFAKPGITGLAQCNGYRGEITDPSLLQKRIELDLQYIATWSIWLDIQITFKTVKQIIFPPKSAY
jgi:exopolysaccharide biosynthesis polyprenyl glycosylphosphotransferase